MDIRAQISQSTDTEYLQQMIDYLKVDIENVGKESSAIQEMKAKMRGLSVEEMNTQTLKGLQDLLNLAEKRLQKI
jgi:hypothetical protein